MPRTNAARKAWVEEGSLDQYLREISMYPLINREEETTLAIRIKQLSRMRPLLEAVLAPVAGSPTETLLRLSPQESGGRENG